MREARSKKPPRPGLVLKRHDKNQEFKFECVKSVMVNEVCSYGSKGNAVRGCR